MDDAFITRWREASEAVYCGIVASTDGYYVRLLHKAHARTTKWFQEFGATAWDATGRAAVRQAWPLDSWTMQRDVPNRLKSLRLGWAIASGDTDVIAPHERDFTALSLARLPWAADFAVRLQEPRKVPPDRHLAAGETLHVSTAFPWRFVGRRGIMPNYAMSRILLPLQGCDAADAPIVARVASGDGGWLDVRQVDGAFFRPVLEPGSWTPIGLDPFIEAMRGGTPWHDSPVADKSGFPHHGNILALSDIADEMREMTKSDLDSEAAAREELVARCGHFLLIDGVVHRRTSEPVLRLTSHRIPPLNHRDILSLDWQMDGLASYDPQDTLNCPPPGPHVYPNVHAIESHLLAFRLSAAPLMTTVVDKWRAAMQITKAPTFRFLPMEDLPGRDDGLAMLRLLDAIHGPLFGNDACDREIANVFKAFDSASEKDVARAVKGLAKLAATRLDLSVDDGIYNGQERMGMAVALATTLADALPQLVKPDLPPELDAEEAYAIVNGF